MGRGFTMNERVKDLLKQSTYEILGVPQVDQKQFAELIIKECARIASNPAPGCHSSFGNIILGHFGVKE